MGVSISIKNNYKKLDRSLDKLGRKQLSPAFAKTLNDTMKAAGKYTTARTYPQSFEARNKAFFEASMFKGKAVTWATKSRLSVAAEDRFDRGNLEHHARGGTQLAKAGRIAIPTGYEKSRRGARGAPKRLRPRTVVDSTKGYLAEDTIYQRYGARGGQRRKLYILRRSVRMPKRFRFYEDAERITKKVSPQLFRRNFCKATETARG
jgi:hypothetical protein